MSTDMFTPISLEPVFDVVSADRSRVAALDSLENQVIVTVVGAIGTLVAEIALAYAEVNGCCLHGP